MQLATLHDEDEISLFFLFLGDLNYDVKYICGCRERKNRASVLVKRNRYKSPYFFFFADPKQCKFLCCKLKLWNKSVFMCTSVLMKKFNHRNNITQQEQPFQMNKTSEAAYV